MNNFIFDEFCFRILEELALSGNRHLRELAERLGMPASTAFKALQKLEDNRLVNSAMQKNRKVFSINYDSPLANNALRLILTQKIMGCKQFNALKGLKPEAIILFGSAASGKISPQSDIDIALFFKGKPDSFKISGIKLAMEKELGKEIQLLSFSAERLESLKKENNELYNQIHYKGIVLSGEMIE
ncbi:MAG: nucleotidyltransferase domain-containing protein [Candidatus Diapherotrites archaeon]|nr:nucleotidyltransferase domain-containing protein [Candidatus Diapherotrites archaeon]